MASAACQAERRNLSACEVARLTLADSVGTRAVNDITARLQRHRIVRRAIKSLSILTRLRDAHLTLSAHTASARQGTFGMSTSDA